MKIINPESKIIEDELAKLTIHQRIEQCGRICYQSEDKITDDSSIPFCERMVKSGHLSVLEMAVVHLVCRSYDVPLSDYVHFDSLDIGENTYVVAASIRSLIEAENTPAMSMFLNDKFPMFFDGPFLVSSEDISDCSAIRFSTQEEIPWQHKHVAVKFIVNRAFSHELVRHRPCSFLQESQRYCRYQGDVVFVNPLWAINQLLRDAFAVDCHWAENRYQVYLECDLSPQQARAVLPNSTKTELICYASLPQWKHIFKMRASKADDPEMQRVMYPLQDEFRARWPEAFASEVIA